jgi:hypothetical protein
VTYYFASTRRGDAKRSTAVLGGDGESPIGATERKDVKRRGAARRLADRCGHGLRDEGGSQYREDCAAHGSSITLMSSDEQRATIGGHQ